MNIDDIKIYLPTYLSDETQKQLFENLKNFPNPFDMFLHKSTNEIPRNNLKKIKIFSLNQSGFYIFLLKLSIHFTRMQERIDRGHN